MSLTPETIAQAAKELREAAASGHFISPLREQYPQLTATDAYAIQALNIQERVNQGKRIIGRKVGLTSQAVQLQLGVDQPDFGVLLDDMAFGDSEPIPASILQQPKVEAEIAFVLKRDLHSERPDHTEVINAIDYVLPAIEVVGSRIANWDIRFVDTVADNASANAYVLGCTPYSLRGLDLRLAGMTMFHAGRLVSTGAGAACLGHPLNAVVWLARMMAQQGSPLRAGEVILSGALGPIATANPGDCFEVHIEGLGSVRAAFDAVMQHTSS